MIQDIGDQLKRAEDSRTLSDDTLVQVRAQVMTRDDEIVGWVPMGGGGMSIVGLRKRVCSMGEDIKHEYLIHGQRLSDNLIVLNCPLKKDVQYVKANPTFHYWRTEDKRFGLTFQTSADAKTFDRGVKRAIEDLLEGSPESTHTHPDLDSGDDDVFVTLDLPLGKRKDSSSQSASTTSTTTSSPTPQSPAINIQESNRQFDQLNHLYRLQFSQRPVPTKASPVSEKSSKSLSSDSKEDIWVMKQADKPPSLRSKSDKDNGSIENDTVELSDYYVHFAKNRPSVNEYYYPSVDSIAKPSSRRNSLSSIKKYNVDMISTQPPVPVKTPKKKKKKDKSKKDKQSPYMGLISQKRSRCVYCNEMFPNNETSRELCEDAPDKVHEFIEKVSCICCARGMLYHCMADADGDYGHPCVCDSSDESNCRKWTALTVLSFLVPCLWCYWPLTACHRCGVACGCCGGRHKAPN